MHLHNQSMFLQCCHTLYTPSFWMPSNFYPAVQLIQANQSLYDYRNPIPFLLVVLLTPRLQLFQFDYPHPFSNAYSSSQFCHNARLGQYLMNDTSDKTQRHSHELDWRHSYSKKILILFLPQSISFPVGAAASKTSALLFLLSFGKVCKFVKSWSNNLNEV